MTVNGRAVTNPLSPGGSRAGRDYRRQRAAAAAVVANHRVPQTTRFRDDPSGSAGTDDGVRSRSGTRGQGWCPSAGSISPRQDCLLLTTDTQLAERLTNPENGVVRRYVVTVRGRVRDEDLEILRAGVDGLQAASVTIRKRSNRETHLIVELREGKNREIRRLFAAVGREVTRLLRVAYGPIELGTLRPGEWRELSAAECARS